jgi:predicted DNA-binding protein (MmcQ/YjbR family)
MVSNSTVRQLALAFPETDEHPHFDKAAFRVKKKLFATLDEKERRAVLKLTLSDQSVFCKIDSSMIYPVPGGWGRQGYTRVELKKVTKAIFKDILTTAYCTIAPAKLAAPFQNN